VKVHDGLHGGLLFNGVTGPPGSTCAALDPVPPCMTITRIVPPPAPGADLALSKTASTPAVNPGGQVSFALTVHNHGPGQATGVTVQDPIPSGLFFQSARPSQGSCTISTSQLICHLGSLASGAQAHASVSATVASNARGTIVNTATVLGDQDDPNPHNNTASATIKVTAVTPVPPPPRPKPPPPRFTG
jgi:uncharacterized repeat protein (TIGR01451 family)